ncbi:helix-turn-helix domain-containing protein [Shewanella marinintestina]|uniref:helix-turn-helix domain-containing protein n=1 Tax=Shewanella marinintestina TaxID=190305 RepID=UPI00200E487E|nr:helix-turn-helix domain-containing protein [Shewanella marinintestina]MCL1144567.1 helix-turn-helix domain-containing protein [Shewanella marinintestina]
MDKLCHDNRSLAKLIRKEKSARMRLKLLAIVHFQDGKSRYQIAEFLKVSRTSVNRWVSNYLSKGLEGLKEKPHSGRPMILTEKQVEQVKLFIDNSVKNSKSGKVKGYTVQTYIEESFGVKYEISSIYKMIERL